MFLGDKKPFINKSYTHNNGDKLEMANSAQAFARIKVNSD